MTNHPITPPPGMVNEWVRMLEFLPDKQVFSLAAQWGADTQLQMDADWVTMQTSNQMSAEHLKAEMRPKPPSLKEQALLVLEDMSYIDSAHYNIIRKALEGIN